MKKLIFSLFTSSLLIVACHNTSKENSDMTGKTTETNARESKEDRNKKIIETSMETFNKGDLDGVFKEVAPNYTDYGDGSSPPTTNLDSTKQLFRAFMNSVEGYKGQNLKYYADGDYVLVQADWVGTFKRDFMGIKATGKPLKFRDIDIFKLNEDGKITEHSSIQNIGAILIASASMK
jgi:ketosteroid isomerase-like protein